ncbi:MAG: hypothetical protein QN122_07060 [Armatimonadota bacterium]|nr:hypothetical protein [Armatimonadota bacterium]MDR7449077.1 hypothetical protein [Armatimonadota bacterium]MDR7459157.1 hypothetical protein [Armatimonadota bacterium]MDR7480429.1 hypothetical protein [Armatimonadota bacterium]MDR7489376.1 hypothetical protein [Armatimonadota bacterium]
MNRPVYLRGIVVLAGASVGLAGLILLAEWRDVERLGIAALGLILMGYGLIVLLMRKAGLIGPRKAEGR